VIQVAPQMPSGADPLSGCLFIFRSQRATAIKVLAYDGQGFWVAQKRLSKGRFVWWPTGKGDPNTPGPMHNYCWRLRPDAPGWSTGVFAESNMKSLSECVRAGLVQARQNGQRHG
jgi:IS66 Orf2 like protein